MSKKNIYWINAVRALAIMAVFLSHIQSSAFYGYSIGGVHKFLSPWYVNSFFFISGYLLFRKQLQDPLINQDRSTFISKSCDGGGYVLAANLFFRIVTPTILFAAIEYIPNCIIRGNEISLEYALYKTIGGGTYWFTSTLAVSELIILILLFTRKRSIWFYFIICFAMGAIGMSLQNGSYEIEIWAAHRGVIAVLFIVCGGLYWRYEEYVNKRMKWYVILTMLMAYVLILLLCKNTDPNISVLKLQPLGIVTAVLSCVLLIEFCKHLPESKTMNYIGQNTIGFYFMSGALPAVITPIIHRIIPGRYFVVMIGEVVLCIILAYIIVYCINRWLPWMFDLRLLKRKRVLNN